MSETTPTSTVVPGRFRQIADVLQTIHKEIGRTAVAFLGGELEAQAPPSPISMGDPQFDLALGGPGLPRQRMIEISGRPAVGKTSLAMALLAQAQRAGASAAYLDVDHGFVGARASALGVNIEPLLIARPRTAEEALTIAETLVRSGAAEVIVLDSIAALVPEAELDGRIGDAPAGLQARLVGQALRRLTVALRNSSATVVFINHLRPGLDGKVTSPGGSALPFFTAVQLHVTGSQLIGDDLVLELQVVKSKLGPSGQRVSLSVPAGLSKTGV